MEFKSSIEGALLTKVSFAIESFVAYEKVLMMNILHVTYEKNFSTSKILASLLDRRQRGPIKSVLFVIIGWLVNWLVTRFSQKRL